MIFYHVSTNLNHNGIITPRIPKNRHKKQEDDTTPRFCVAPTIADCLTAMPNGGSDLSEQCELNGGVFCVLKIDTDKLNFSKDCIINSEFLYENDLVRDADITNEHWVLSEFEIPLEDRFICRLLSWEEESDVIPFNIMKLAEDDYEGDYLEAYMDATGDLVPSTIVITNPVIQATYSKGEVISFDIDDKYVYQSFLDFLRFEKRIVVVNENGSNIDLILDNIELSEVLSYYSNLH